MKLSQKKFAKELEEVIAFGWSKKGTRTFTVRKSIDNAKTRPDFQTECPEAFGMSFADTVAMLETYCDLDKKYYPTPLF
jgi:hypothetical protein